MIRSIRLRIFLTVWIVGSVFFATNVVREHYPAFALIDHGNFRLDEYEGFHSDIFKHTDGHCYVGNQVAGSVVAAVPLLVFDPALDWLEEKGRGRPTVGGDAADAEYETEYPNRAAFYRKVRERGWDLRFGGATAVTSVFLMAPIAAWLCVVMFGVLRQRGVGESRAALIAVGFGLATPLLYRTAHLNHNVFLMGVIFGSFLLLWRRGEGGTIESVSTRRRVIAGFLAGCALALDYAGIVPLFCLFGYLLVTHRSQAGGWRDAIGAGIPFVIGSVPPVVFLCATQWWMYGDPFLPGQFWMPEVNYTDEGWRGFGLPSLHVFAENLFSRDYGLFPFGPILILGVLPMFRRAPDDAVVPTRERRFMAIFCLAFLVFCAANRYSLMQWNTGFRYLLPVVPFLFLLVVDGMRRMNARTAAVVVGIAVVHSVCLAMMRYTPPDRLNRPDETSAIVGTYERLLESGPQLPWLNVLRSTSSLNLPLVNSSLLPTLVLIVTAVVVMAIWRGRRAPPA